MMTRRPLASASALALLMTGCAAGTPPAPVERPPTPEIVRQAEAAEPQLRSTIVPGTGDVPTAAPGVMVEPKRGDITLNFPAADVHVVAKAVLGDLLHVQYNVAPGLSVQVAFVTPGPVARSAVLDLFEAALKNAGLALVSVQNGFSIEQSSAAQGNGPVAPGVIGYGSEVIPLQFINAGQLKSLLDSVLPGVVAATDPAQNALTIVGTTGQRNSAHELIKQFDVNWLRNMSFALFVPERTDSRLIVPELEKLINANDSPTKGLVRLIAMDNLNGILAITAQPQYIEDVRRWIDILDREGQGTAPQLFVYKVQNGRARDLAQTINNALGNGGTGGDTADAGAANNPDPFATPNSGTSTTSALTTPPVARDTAQGAPAPGSAASATGTAAPQTGRITADEVNNAVIVYGTPREYAVIEAALRQLDVRPVQVLIEAAITEVTLTDQLRYGVQWNFQTGNSNFAYTEGTTTAPTRISPGFSFFYAGNDISAALNALEQRTNVKVISAPKILVLNNQTAALQVGDEVPVTTAAATNLEGGSVNGAIVNSIDYRDTGVILKVTPRVNASGLVLLDISQEVSNVSAATTSTVATNQSPTISTRRVSTSIAAQDGQVITLGGLFSSSKSFGRNGIPILSRIPILGGLFGTHMNDERRTELIVLLKPHVVRTVDDGTAITEELRRKLRTLEPFRTQGTIP